MFFSSENVFLISYAIKQTQATATCSHFVAVGVKTWVLPCVIYLFVCLF